MTFKKPEHILCAVRGHPQSRETVTRAVDLALENQARLTFFLVVDAEFMSKASPTYSSLKTVYQQLEEMGEFSMLILCDRAKRRGVEHAGYLIRKGNVPEQIRKMAVESGAQMMVMGRPMRSLGKRVFSPEEFDRFVAELEESVGIQIVQVVHEEVASSSSS